MVNPWTILWYGFGWALVGVCALGIIGWVTVKIVAPIAEAICRWRRYRRTRNVAPVPGSVWDQGGSTLEITRIADNGRICMTTGGASWSDSPSEWTERVRNRRVYLVRPPAPPPTSGRS